MHKKVMRNMAVSNAFFEIIFLIGLCWIILCWIAIFALCTARANATERYWFVKKTSLKSQKNAFHTGFLESNLIGYLENEINAYQRVSKYVSYKCTWNAFWMRLKRQKTVMFYSIATMTAFIKSARLLCLARDTLCWWSTFKYM